MLAFMANEQQWNFIFFQLELVLSFFLLVGGGIKYVCGGLDVYL